MSMPNRFCVIERRLDIIEKVLKIEIPRRLLVYRGDIMGKEKDKMEKEIKEFVNYVEDIKIQEDKDE